MMSLTALSNTAFLALSSCFIAGCTSCFLAIVIISHSFKGRKEYRIILAQMFSRSSYLPLENQP
jgi:ABC-type Fe3+ transport system permease subunit